MPHQTPSHARLPVLALLAAAALAALAGPAQAARPQDPDFPCVQVLVPKLSPGQIWTGPPIDAVEPGAWTKDPELVRLIDLAASRMVPTPDLVKALDGFAATAGPDANERLTLLFAGMFDRLQEQRAGTLEAVRRFARGQRTLMDRIAERVRAVEAAAPGAERDQALEALATDRRILDDRRRMLPTLCESPVLVERRLGAAARALAAHLK